MANISYKKRTGKDLFEFMKMSIMDSKSATNAAMQKYVLVDGEPLTLEQLSLLTGEAYIIISTKIFPMNFDNDDIIFEDNEGIHWKEIIITRKDIKRNFIDKVQTDNKNHIKIMKQCISNFYDIDISYLEEESFELAAFLVSKVNFFLSKITSSDDNYELSNLWIRPPGKITDGKLDSMVPDSGEIAKTNE